MTFGVLALQGAFRSHIRVIESLGEEANEIRLPGQLDSVDALIMPGGESTTMSMLLESSGLFDAIGKRLADGMPVFGTCAGLILLSTEILDGRSDQRSFGALELSVRRNGYGRQVESFESDLDTTMFDAHFHAVFIRAPRIESVGESVEVLALGESGEPVLVRRGNVLASSFHPELSNDDRIHRFFVESVA